MKIAISAKGKDLSSHVAPLSEPDTGFIVYDPDRYSFTVLDKARDDGRCPQEIDGWVDTITDAGVDVLVVGGIAVEAAHQLSRSGIRVYECISATVWEAIQALKLNLLRTLDTDPEGIRVWNAVRD